MSLSIGEIEAVLSLTVQELSNIGPAPEITAQAFERTVRETLNKQIALSKLIATAKVNEQAFPDISLGEWGVEVKFTAGDSWRSVANSVRESTRDQSVSEVYLIYGRRGGAEVKWRKYEDCVVHVRTSHVPRFEVDMEADRSLFDLFGVSYTEFQELSFEARMEHVRRYARGRLKPGERLWWLENEDETPHTLPLQVTLYTKLTRPEKLKARAEAAVLCPQIVKGGRSKDKYDDAVLYLMTYRGILCSQARDLFSAGSAGGTAKGRRGGNYILEGLRAIEAEMLSAFQYLEPGLFEEYWNESPSPEDRLSRWLEKADQYAVAWRPSEFLFRAD